MESRWKNSALGPSERPLPANPFTELSPSQAPLPDLKAELTEIAQHVSSGISFFFFLNWNHYAIYWQFSALHEKHLHGVNVFKVRT